MLGFSGWLNEPLAPSQSITTKTLPMGNKEICILVVHDDPIYNNVVSNMLSCCSHYEVLKQTFEDALSTLRENKDRLILFVTAMHPSNTKGFELLRYIEKEFTLDILSMSLYETGLSVTLYFLKSLSVNDFKRLWQYAYAQVQAGLGRTTLFCEVAQGDLKGKGIESQEVAQGLRVSWKDWMHEKFLEAVKELGLERAVPKKILEFMDLPRLKRESVASHLQKYRMQLRRAEEAMQSTGAVPDQKMKKKKSTGAVHGSKLTAPLDQKYFSSIHFAQNLNSSRGHRLTNSCLFHPGASTGASSLGNEQLLAGTCPYYGRRVSPFDATARNAENYYGFGTAPLSSQTGLGHSAQVYSGCLPGTQVKRNCETDFVPGIGNGQNSNAVSAYVGYRLACNGESVETGQTFVLGDDVTAGGGNESLVQTLLASDNDILQEQPSQPPVHSVGHDLEDLGAEGEVGHLLDTVWYPQFTLVDDSIDAVFGQYFE